MYAVRSICATVSAAAKPARKVNFLLVSRIGYMRAHEQFSGSRALSDKYCSTRSGDFLLCLDVRTRYNRFLTCRDRWRCWHQPSKSMPSANLAAVRTVQRIASHSRFTLAGWCTSVSTQNESTRQCKGSPGFFLATSCPGQPVLDRSSGLRSETLSITVCCSQACPSAG